MMEDRNKQEKAKMEEEKERLNQLMAKIKYDSKELPMPLPNDYQTFDKICQIQNKSRETKSQKKGLGFGIGTRIPLDEKEKWAIKVERYNKNSDKPLDPKSDIIPGPLTYNLIANWGGKRGKKDKENQKEPNIFKVMTKEPRINPYYAHY